MIRGASLAVRLTAWYAVTGFLLVAGAAWLQYRSLARDLASEDDQLLVETLAAVEGGIPLPTDAPTPARSVGPLIRELDADCAIVRGPQPPIAPPPLCDSIRAGRPTFRTWHSPTGRNWRILALRTAGNPPRRLEVMLDRWTDEHVLQGYRHELAVVLPMALFLSAALGYGIARRGLAPLSALARRMASVNARSLDQRLDSPGSPAEIQALVASFHEMLERLNGAFAALTEFSAELAHELRTPIHIMRQHGEVALAQARSPAEYREVLSSALEELDRLRRMVDDTLFLARAEDPRSNIDRQLLDVTAELRDVAEYLDAVAAERGIQLVVEAPDGLCVLADRALLRRALVNLVTNAARHTPRGGRVRIAAHDDRDAVVVEVSDTGAGIPPEALPRVFDRYYRLPAADGNGKPSESTGLGLAIVRGIMGLHRGTATVSSEVGQGTCVALRFPASSNSAV